MHTLLYTLLFAWPWKESHFQSLFHCQDQWGQLQEGWGESLSRTDYNGTLRGFHGNIDCILSWMYVEGRGEEGCCWQGIQLLKSFRYDEEGRHSAHNTGRQKTSWGVSGQTPYPTWGHFTCHCVPSAQLPSATGLYKLHSQLSPWKSPQGHAASEWCGLASNPGAFHSRALALSSILGCTLNYDDRTVSFCLLALLPPGLPVLYTF